jgi:hypothetical protein
MSIQPVAVAVAVFAGVMPPLIGSWLSGSPNSVTARVIRAASGGIILALALVSSCWPAVGGGGGGTPLDFGSVATKAKAFV